MTYNELQESFKCEHAVFSAWKKSDETAKDWDAKNAFKDGIADRVAFKASFGTLRYEGWDSSYEETFSQQPLTWYEVMKFFERALIATKDQNHVFLEKVKWNPKRRIAEIIAGS